MSAAETLLAVQLEQAGIPFLREYAFAAPRRRWRADFYIAIAHGRVLKLPTDGKGTFQMAYPPTPLLVEIDGGGYVAGRHSRGLGMAHDAEKQSAAAILGYRVIRCVPSQVEDGTALNWIRQALGLEAAA